jgi:hypothetical protein
LGGSLCTVTGGSVYTVTGGSLWAVLGGSVSPLFPDGSPPKENDNKIVFTLINIEEEISLQQTSLKVNTTNKIGKNFHTIYILVHSNFEYYAESLELLDFTIDFFIENSIFNAASSPNFPVELERVRLEPINLTIEQICSLWSSIGAKYQPSVLYRVRIA